MPADPAPIRVLVVDDHPLAQAGLRFFLQGFPGLELVGSATDGADALTQAERLQPDVILMDLMMPGVGGVEATRLIRERLPRVRVLVLTSFPDGDLVQQALRAGATGYLLKTASAFDLAQAVRAAHAGRPVLAPEATAALTEAMRRPDDPTATLTEREREVLALVAEGLDNATIAGRMGITRATVKFHLGGVFAKLGVTTRAEAIALVYQRKLVT